MCRRSRRSARRRGALSLAVFAAGLVALGARADDEPAAETSPSWFAQHLSGSFRTEYQYRSAGNEKDADLYEYFYARGRDMAGGWLDAYASGKLQWDIDGASTSLADDRYAGAEDLGGDIETRLYQLYIDAHDPGKDVRLRLGRQYVDIADSIHLDGGQLILYEDKRIGGRVFAGVPVSYYSSVSDDIAGGVSVVGRPWLGNITRLTGTWYYDDSEDATEGHYVLESRHQWCDAFNSRVRAALIDDSFQMAGVDAYYFPAADAFNLVAGAYRWGTIDARTRAFSPLYRTLGELNPYTYLYARGSLGAFNWLRISPGVAARLVDSSERDANNRDYRHADLTFTIEPNRSVDFSVAGEYWDVESGDRFFGVTGEARCRGGKRWELAGGAAYAEYDYERDTDLSYVLNGGQTVISRDGTRVSVSPDILTYFARAKVNIGRALSVRLRGEVEDNSLEDELSYAGRLTTVLRF